jgi:hypothetical protein
LASVTLTFIFAIAIYCGEPREPENVHPPNSRRISALKDSNARYSLFTSCPLTMCHISCHDEICPR